jgi:ATP-dependent Clp protease protease subunit
VEKDVERDFFMDADEAKVYGIVDEIVTKSKAPMAKSKEN